jgi:hypothetical protein
LGWKRAGMHIEKQKEFALKGLCHEILFNFYNKELIKVFEFRRCSSYDCYIAIFLAVKVKTFWSNNTLWRLLQITV